MNYKAIEAALVKCETIDPVEWTESCQLLWMQHGLDLLRIVRAMAWCEEHKADMVMVGDAWVCEGIGWEDVPYTGPTIIDAIEAAMADQQTKGVDESP